MKIISAFLCVLCASAFISFGQSTPVLFPVNSLFGGAAYNKPITITAANTLITDGQNLWAGTYQIIPASTTNVIFGLYPNTYLMQITGVVKPVRFTVPASTNVLNVVPMINGGPYYFFGTNLSLFSGLNVSSSNNSVVINATTNNGGLANFDLALPGTVVTATPSTYFAAGSLTNSYLITNSPFAWLNIPVYWNQALSVNGALVYTNMATNGLPVFLAYADPALAGLLNNLNNFWDISTNFFPGSTPPAYVNKFSAQDNNSDLTNLFGNVWGFYPASLAGSVQVFAQQNAAVAYRLFMFQSSQSPFTNQVLAFAGAAPVNLAPAGVVFADTNAGVTDTIRDVCHVAYTDNTGKTTYLLAWSHYGVGQGMGIATAPDDTNYVFLNYVGLALSASFSNQACWSPKIFIDATNGLQVTALLGPTNVNATPTNIIIAELNPLTFTNVTGLRLLNVDANIGGAAALYAGGLYYYYSASGVVWTNTTLASGGWKSAWTNSAGMIGGSVVPYAGLFYWYATFGNNGMQYSTSTNLAGPWSAPVAQPFPAPDFAQGDGTFLQLAAGPAQTIALNGVDTFSGTFTGTFTGNGGGLTNLADVLWTALTSPGWFFLVGSPNNTLALGNFSRSLFSFETNGNLSAFATVTASNFIGNGAGLTSTTINLATNIASPFAPKAGVGQVFVGGPGGTNVYLVMQTAAGLNITNKVALNGQYP